MRVSIVMPNRNGAEYLEDAISSVLTAADGLNVEFIVSDGGSTDESLDIIKRYSGRLSRWISEPDEGQYFAVDRAFGRTTGEVLAWLNSDDLYHPEALRIVSGIFDALPEVEWLTTLRPGSIAGDAIPAFRSVPGYSARAFSEGRYVPENGPYSFGAIQQESTFWRRSLWERAGARLDCRYRLAADFELWSRFFSQACLYAVDLPLGMYRYRPGQRGADIASYMQEVDLCLGGAERRETLRKHVLRPSLRAAPVIAPVLRAVLGYDGAQVVRTGSAWAIRRYRFF